MLSKTQASALLKFKFPGSIVESGIDFEDLWVFRIYLPIHEEEQGMNPFMSVDKKTGDVNDFSITACSNPVLLMTRFAVEDNKSERR
jgi:hypothetical protein